MINAIAIVGCSAGSNTLLFAMNGGNYVGPDGKLDLV